MKMNSVEQISVFLENKSGRLAEVTQILAEAGINLVALSIAETSDFGILRFICDQPAQAAEALQAGGFSVGRTEVLAVQVSHRPGGLAEAVEVIAPLDANIEYLYAFAGHSGREAVVVMRLENGRTQEVAEALQAAGYTILSAAEAYSS